jgi:hypothetical protein
MIRTKDLPIIANVRQFEIDARMRSAMDWRDLFIGMFWGFVFGTPILGGIVFAVWKWML